MLHPTVGRVLSALGAIAAVVALFLVWYHVDRPAPLPDSDSTGWQTFTRLRWLVLGGAALTLLSAAVAQIRPVLVARTLLGLVVAALIFRRIVSPPELNAELDPQLGLWIGVVGALLIALGGLVDTGRRVVAAYPDFPLWGRPAAQLDPGPGPRPSPAGAAAPLPRTAEPQRVEAEYEVLPPRHGPE